MAEGKRGRREAREGEVAINSPKVSTGRIGKDFVVLHVPTDRFVVLYEYAERIWKKIESGTHDIALLVREHAAENQVPAEVAAFEVISFLDEIRALGLVSFRLRKERQAAPLIDTPLSLEDLRLEDAVAQLLLPQKGNKRARFSSSSS
jgi:Coenzyme PQQ synthesis protein D (PqqD)